MKPAQILGLGLTLVAVLVLLGSLVLGLAGEPEGERARESAPSVESRVRVEVLNVAGIAGLARAATVRLRDRGFDVVFYGNGRGFDPDSSLVLDRAGREGAAEAVAEAVGISSIRSRPDSTLYLDVTVVLGRDWEGAPDTTGAVPRER